jgi:uncharacterized protein (TIGR01244 family)
MIRLDAKTLVAGQIRPGELTGLKAAGVAGIVNNRPDGEEPGQPTSQEMEAAAKAAGLRYRHIPVAGGFSQAQVEAMAEALGEEGELLAFCRSGTRSTFLWALARSAQGVPAEELAEAAAAAGYDLRPIRPLL